MKSLQDRITWAFKEAKKRNPDLTKTSLWKACGISSGAVSLWFNGSTQEIDGKNAKVVAQILGVDRDWLAFGKGKPLSGTNVAVVEQAQTADSNHPLDDGYFSEPSARILAMQAGLLAVIRSLSHNPNLPVLLDAELARAKDILAANPVADAVLAAFDDQAELIRLTADTHHGKRS